MNVEEMKVVATQVIEDGYAADEDEDDIKMAMFAAKIPFSRLNAMFKSISIELGLMEDPKVVTEQATVLIAKVPWANYTTWTEIEEVVGQLVQKVKGSTAARVITLIRSYCRDEEIKLPTRAKAGVPRARGGKVPAAIVALFVLTPNPTKADFYNTVLPLVKGHKNAIDYMNMFFGVCLAVKGGVELPGVVEALKTQTNPVDPNPEAVVENSEDENGEDDDDEVLE